MIFLILQEIKRNRPILPWNRQKPDTWLDAPATVWKYQSWRGSSAKLDQPTFKAYFELLCSTNFTSNSTVKFSEQVVLFDMQPSSSPKNVWYMFLMLLNDVWYMFLMPRTRVGQETSGEKKCRIGTDELCNKWWVISHQLHKEVHKSLVSPVHLEKLRKKHVVGP
jgi:hypothetical protein